MAEFIPDKGFENCPKCGGWQVLDKTMRKPNGWPIGPVVVVDCDNCAGAGQIKLPEQPKPITIRDNSGLVKAAGWGAPPPQPAPEPLDGPRGGWGAPVEPKPVASGWGVFNKDKTDE